MALVSVEVRPARVAIGHTHARTSRAREVKEECRIRWLASGDLLTIGELSARSGVSTSALRSYEQIGLIAARRSAGNQRRYARHMLRRVSLVSVAKRLGIPLSDVRSALSTVPLDRTPSQADWQRASRQWKVSLEERRRAIERLERELTGCIGCGCLSMRSCTLLNPDDALAVDGPGARRLDVAADPDR